MSKSEESRLVRLVTLHLPANRANESWHWRKERRLRDAYKLRATVLQPWRPAEPYDTLRVEATLFLYNAMDEDNLAARMKWPLDWLEDREFIVNDKNIRLKVDQQIDRKNQRLEMRVLLPE